MAAIDKTYITNVKDYIEFIDWAKDKEYKCPNGCIVKPMDYLYEWDMENLKNAIENHKEVAILNTDLTIDYFLIKYCPLEFIQKRMSEVYSDIYINNIKNNSSLYDTFKRDVSNKTKCIKESDFCTKDFLDTCRVDNKKIYPWWIEVKHPEYSLWYNDELDIWIIDGYELGKHSGNVCTKTIKSKRALIRQILKWKLPKGCEVRWEGEYVGDDIIFKTI